MRALILAFFILFSFDALAKDENASENIKKNYKLKEGDLKLLKSLNQTDENTSLPEKKELYLASSALVLSTDEYPSSVFVGELFAIRLKAKTDEKTKFNFDINISKSDDLELLNPDSKWEKGSSFYENTLYFEAKSPNAYLDKITVILSRNAKAFQSSALLINKINFKSLQHPPDYSKLVANSLKIGDVKTTRYDDKHQITLIALLGEHTNLKDFKIQNMIKQGIEDIDGDYEKAKAYYFGISQNGRKSLAFSYYNLLQERFINFKIPIKIEDEILSTQSDLNPKNSKYNLYKQAIIIALIILLALLFIVKRSILALLLAIILLAFFMFITKDNANAVLIKGARLKLLPTTNSTIFYVNHTACLVEVLDYKDEYVKVVLPSTKIGWALKKDLKKDEN